MKVLVLAGTSEGKELIYYLLEKGHNVIATTCSERGRELILDKCNSTNLSKEDQARLRVISKSLDENTLKSLVLTQGVMVVVDATHPFAKNITATAKNVCIENKIEYVRYERDSIENLCRNTVEIATSIKEAGELARGKGGRVLSTIGSNALHELVEVIGADKVVARVLPIKSSIEKCEMVGIKLENIIAIKGPFSKEMNKCQIKDYNIDIVITKDSGTIGGTLEKIEAADELGVTTILVKREQNNYSKIYNSKCEIEEFIKNINCFKNIRGE